MASRVPAQQTPAQLCDFCHQKPKFSNHGYCSKTCATQAATLCNFCHKKPKFQNFDFCGKHCASQANVKPPQTRNVPATKGALPQPQPQLQPQLASLATSLKKGFTAVTSQNSNQPSNGAFDPVQIAKLVVQQIPQLQALLPSQQPNAAPAPAVQPIQPQAPPVPAKAPNSKSTSNNPFLNPAYVVPPVAGYTAQNGTAASLSNLVIPPSSQLNSSSTDDDDDEWDVDVDSVECLIPGCGQPVHADAKGLKMSEYCSKRHREEAVASGLVSPCIMCLTLPQGEVDHFCGRDCRQEALTKPMDGTALST